MSNVTTNMINVHSASGLGISGAKQAALEGVAKDFESVFMAQMLKPMWDGVKTDETFGGGAGEDVMRDMLIQEYGKAMVRGDRFGLAPAIMEAMLQMQQVADSKAGGNV